MMENENGTRKKKKKKAKWKKKKSLYYLCVSCLPALVLVSLFLGCSIFFPTNKLWSLLSFPDIIFTSG